MQISNCVAEEQEGKKITVNKISVAMETIKNSLPTLPLLPGNVQLSSFTPHYSYFLIMNNFFLSIGFTHRTFQTKTPAHTLLDVFQHAHTTA